jgi:hypothetical protein
MRGLIEQTKGTRRPRLVFESPRVPCGYHCCQLDNVVQRAVRCINDCKGYCCMSPESLLFWNSAMQCASMATKNGVGIMSEAPKAMIESCNGLTTLRTCSGTLTIYPTAPTNATIADQKASLEMVGFARIWRSFLSYTNQDRVHRALGYGVGTLSAEWPMLDAPRYHGRHCATMAETKVAIPEQARNLFHGETPLRPPARRVGWPRQQGRVQPP